MIPAERARIAADIYASRRTRDEMFTDIHDGFGEPAWDMLLCLYIADFAGATQTAADLVHATHVEIATAKPYLGWLASQGLIQVDHEEVVLLQRGKDRMDAYIDRLGMRQISKNTH
jgi:hypothetical protein